MKSTLIHGACIIKGAKTDATLSDGALLVEAGKIKDVGLTSELLKKHADAERFDASGQVITPGFVNAHTHAPMGFFRGLGHAVAGDNSESMIERFLFPAERSLTAELIEPLSYSYVYAGLRSGTTCFSDHYYFVGGVAAALERFGMRGVVGETIADLGGAFPGRQAWDDWRKTVDSWPHSSRITPSVAPHAADTVSAPLMKELGQFARTRNLPLHLHLSQTRGERERVHKREGCSPVAYAERCGVLGARTLAVHLVSADQADVAILARTKTAVGFCPASELIYERLPPIASFVDAGLKLALATDAAASNDDADMLGEMRLAALLLRDRMPGRATVMQEALAMATVNGAEVFGLGQITGEIAVGKAADLCFLAPDLGSLPWQSPLANLVYSTSSRHVRHVMVDGRFVLRDGKPCLFSEADATAAYLEAVRAIKRRLGL